MYYVWLCFWYIGIPTFKYTFLHRVGFWFVSTLFFLSPFLSPSPSLPLSLSPSISCFLFPLSSLQPFVYNIHNDICPDITSKVPLICLLQIPLPSVLFSTRSRLGYLLRRTRVQPQLRMEVSFHVTNHGYSVKFNYIDYKLYIDYIDTIILTVYVVRKKIGWNP